MHKLAKASITICGLSGTSTVALVLPGEYLMLNGPEEYLLLLLLVSPYLFMGLIAWCSREQRRTSMVLFIFVSFLALVGLYLIGSESYGYQSSLKTHPRGPEYAKTRYQRMALFLVPALQWLLALVVGAAVLVQLVIDRRSTTQEQLQATPHDNKGERS